VGVTANMDTYRNHTILGKRSLSLINSIYWPPIPCQLGLWLYQSFVCFFLLLRELRCVVYKVKNQTKLIG